MNNIEQTLQQLIDQFPDLIHDVQPYIKKKQWIKDDRRQLINTLVQQLLTDDEHLEYFFRNFSIYFIPFIHRLCAAVQGTHNQAIRERFVCTLAKILPYFPTLQTLTEKYMLNSSSLFLRFDTNESPRKKFKPKTSPPSTEQLVLSALRFLFLNFSHYSKLWNWSSLVNLHSVTDDERIKWLTYVCLSIVLNMSSEQRLKLQSFLRLHVSNETILKLHQTIHPLLSFDSSNIVQDKVELFIADDFKKRTTYIANVPLAKDDYEMTTKLDLIQTPSIEKCLKELTLGISLGWSILLYSPLSNGKTSLIEYLAQQSGKRLVKIQCSDHMDSKVLLGTYQCTDKPGEFIWTPGLLVESTSEGNWLLMEDINCASSDVLSVIQMLIETKTIFTGGSNINVQMSPDFRLFLTQRDTGIPNQSNELLHLLKSLFCVVFPSYADQDVLQIMEQLYPNLNELLPKLFELYQLLRHQKSVSLSGVISNKTASKRVVTLRDLLKCCRRLSTSLLNESLNAEFAFYDAFDCFVSFLSKTDRQQITKHVGTVFNINPQQSNHYAFNCGSDISETDTHFVVGNVQLEIKKAANYYSQQQRQQQCCFARTRSCTYLIERIARCVQMNEPVLLCGETGVGKTTLVQYLANKTGNRLYVINLSQQSDAVDLLGGYKPLDTHLIVRQTYKTFLNLFSTTYMNQDKTQFTCLDQIEKCMNIKRFKEAIEHMLKEIEPAKSKCSQDDNFSELIDEWSQIKQQLDTLLLSIKKHHSALIFRFVEGALVQALRRGDWILLDEINLATSDTLQLLSGILESQEGTIWLAERGDKQPIRRHPDFRLFGCMNPASDIGKRDIPIGIRNRFTEFYVDEPDEQQDLLIIVQEYLRNSNVNKETVGRIVEFYLTIRKDVASYSLTSSVNSRISITYSLRTLCRALRYSTSTGFSKRTLYEGFCMSFFSQLDRSFYPVVAKRIAQQILPETTMNSLLSMKMKQPTDSKKYVEIEGYWILQGDKKPITNDRYIFTETVKENLKNVARILSARFYPILLQGETSVGKTSLIRWLADATGHHCVRINNHEHTDIQEYIGTYTATASGDLLFREGILVEAMRKGFWIILDELNLAPSDVLEALNRVLDENRELFITETQETVQAHERFQLFATQNPAGGRYGGRKLLSRAFRNRFIELNFSELPRQELVTIIHRKSDLPESYSQILVTVMHDLQKHRSKQGVFAGKHSLITLRDLFRWAERYAMTKECNDWKQFLAEHGYLLLACRSRDQDDVNTIRSIIEKHFSKQIDDDKLFSINDDGKTGGSKYSTSEILAKLIKTNKIQHICWTKSFRRLAILTALCLQYDEPALLIGETGYTHIQEYINE
ncbi:unnamed protein product [Didymodactylos carnosus]|uniref:Midasin n=1 Tax=Didymodactylos carnosus TaxID=1234261 RepID=A0A814VVW9_9BILA|nr:unnamed protein product [Didymodactylos carnosus]CAF3958294.1 unnamed protein product [Didymodactylos carnosus]